MRAHLDNSPEEQAWIDQHMAIPHQLDLAAAAMAVTIDTFHIHGKDISSYQPVGNFAEGGRRFAIFKATEGVTYTDPHFAANRDDAHAEAGIELVGIYHFARNQRNAAAAEYAHFRAVVGAPRPREVLVLDAESGWNQPWFCAFADAAAADGWTVRLFYTYSAMWTSNAHDQIPAHFTHGWVAGYSRALPAMPGWAAGPTWWQHTDGQASVPGNDGGTDCSVFVPNDIDTLRSIAGVPAPTPPQPQEDDDMAYLLKAAGHDEIYLVDGLHKLHIVSPTTAGKYLAAGFKFVDGVDQRDVDDMQNA